MQCFAFLIIAFTLINWYVSFQNFARSSITRIKNVKSTLIQLSSVEPTIDANLAVLEAERVLKETVGAVKDAEMAFKEATRVLQVYVDSSVQLNENERKKDLKERLDSARVELKSARVELKSARVELISARAFYFKLLQVNIKKLIIPEQFKQPAQKAGNALDLGFDFLKSYANYLK
jgi:hypothetical protein